MNRKILSALLIAVITVSMYFNCDAVTNENQETEKISTVSEVDNLNSGISKTLSEIVANTDKKLYSGVMGDIYLDLHSEMMTRASMSDNETEMVSEPLEETVAEPETITIKFTNSMVNCRSNPDINSEILTTVDLGAEIQTVGNEKGWVKVKLGENSYGYIYEEYVRDTNPLQYIGEYKLTYYTDSVRCCGKAGQPTASGVYPVDGITVAADSSIPFGTKLYIDGNIYTVQDRGGAIKGNVLDVYKDLPDEILLEMGVDYSDVYIYTE